MGWASNQSELNWVIERPWGTYGAGLDTSVPSQRRQNMRSRTRENSTDCEEGNDVETGRENPLDEDSASPAIVPDLQLEGELGPLPTSQVVRFHCHAPEARSVLLVGTFNGWDPRAAPMTKNAEGIWGIEVELEPGRYRYEFVLDGQPSCEPGPDGTYHEIPDCVSSECGILNRVIEIT